MSTSHSTASESPVNGLSGHAPVADPRQQRGLAIAATAKLRRKGDLWIVPSQTDSDDRYEVDLSGDFPRCTCPDHTMRRVKCKHIYAVEYTIKRETAPDGTTTVTKTVRVTYTQDWPAYNAAQTAESERLPELLAGLCRGIVQPPQAKGRPRLPLSDVVFGAVLKVYSTMSGRRAAGDLTACHAKGYLSRVPHFNSVSTYLNDPDLTPILKALIEESASPLRAVETDFAVDSSAFTTSRFEKWYDAKYGKTVSEYKWIKAHLMCGVRTNVVTSVEITGGAANDSPLLPQLVTATAARFAIAEVSADKGYISSKNLEAIAAVGETPYVPFKVNSSANGPELWRKMYHYYHLHRDDFLSHYHKRSNVETVFSMIKRKFGDAVRSKADTAQVNEILCKVLCHNLCVVIASIYELGIEGTFWADGAVAQKVAL